MFNILVIFSLSWKARFKFLCNIPEYPSQNQDMKTAQRAGKVISDPAFAANRIIASLLEFLILMVLIDGPFRTRRACGLSSHSGSD